MSKIGASKRGRLNDKIHAEMRRIALKRHPYCVVCGRSDGILQGGHLIPKSNSTAVRYDLMNVFTQCLGCNSLHRFNPHPFIGWFINEYGAEEYQDLVSRSKSKVKPIKLVELEEILEGLKNI